MKKKLNIIFFGTPDFSVPTLEALSKATFCDIKAVVTQPDKPVGRHHSTPIPSPVKQAAQGLKIAVLEGLNGLKGVNADLGVVVAYGEILPQSVIDMFPLGLINIHPSLLPKYRGSSPIQAAILNQDKETGVSIIQLDKEMDHGPILAQERLSLRGSTLKGINSLTTEAIPESSTGLLRRVYTLEGARNDSPTAGELYDKLFQMGADLLIKILPDYIAGKIELKSQDDSQATYTKKLTKEDGKIDWTKSPAAIAAQVRAMNPWPGAWTRWQGKRLIVWRISESGEIKELQLEGSKRMMIDEFLRGRPEFRNVKFQSSNVK